MERDVQHAPSRGGGPWSVRASVAEHGGEALMSASTSPGPAAAPTRQVTRTDPAAAAAEGLSMSGLRHLQALQRGDLPGSPIEALLGLRLLDVQQGLVRLGLTPQELHYNPLASVHGGVLTTLLDSAMARASISTLEAGYGCASSELKVNFLRPVRVETGDLTATGRVLSRGRRTLFCEGAVHDQHGELVAHATSTCVIAPARPA